MINQERLLSTFLDLVRVDNPSRGEAAIAAHIRGLLEAIGLTVEEDAVHNLLARVPGDGEPLLLNAHMDSVAPCIGKQPVVRDGQVRVEIQNGHRFIAEVVEAFPGAIDSVGLHKPSLEDVFVRETGAGIE